MKVAILSVLGLMITSGAFAHNLPTCEVRESVQPAKDETVVTYEVWRKFPHRAEASLDFVYRLRTNIDVSTQDFIEQKDAYFERLSRRVLSRICETHTLAQ